MQRPSNPYFNPLVHLQQELDSLLKQLSNEQEVRQRLESLVSVYPFNEYEYIISTLLAMDVLTLDAYHNLGALPEPKFTHRFW